ncbi:glycosyltransferase [Frateuria hangzhouensis]|uniref:glycosyltransferase n=1 Tax=Frateuria hangzhouensis TaxID=2995589 RepID=UPI002260B2C1|nr:glycosyltransferase [Frateuria sp. STR12]MCX7512887.1 glycosyltransferase [Frateuria sp. STR12]
MNLLGMDVGSHLLDPDSVNAKGYWEHAEAVHINDRLLGAFDMVWWSLEPLPDGWLGSAAASRAREEIKALVHRDFLKVPLWGIKDPRMCRVAPLWIECLQTMGISVSAVFTARAAIEVAKSLKRAQGLREQAGVLSWILHLADSERATRELPRSLIEYDQLLSDPVGTLERIGRDLQVTWPIPPSQRESALGAFLDSAMRNHRGAEPNGWTPPIVARMETETRRIASGRADSDWKALGALSDEAIELFRLLDYREEAPLPNEVVRSARTSDDRSVQASLYHAAEGEHFSEDRVEHRAVPPGRSLVELPVVAGADLRYRLDPASRGGYYVFHAVFLRDAERRMLWNWEDSPGEVSLSGIYSLESPSHPGSVVHRVDGDPQMIFAWPDGVVRPGTTLVLDVERFNAQRIAVEFDALESQFGNLVRQLDAARTTAGERERRLKEKLRLLRAERDARETAFLTIERQVSEIATSMEPLQLALARQEVAIRTLTHSDLLSRLRRRFSRVRAKLQPLQQLELVNAGDSRYKVTGDDPIFACAYGGYPLAPGWYMVDLEMVQHQGPPAQAMLYPNYGPGVPADQGIRLSFFDPQRHRHVGLIRFPHTVFDLRFDPAMAPCELSVRKLVLRRVGKLRAALTLFRSIGKAGRGGIRLNARRGGFIKRLRASGLSAMTDRVYRNYTDMNESFDTYDAWIAQYDRVSGKDLQDARTTSGSWGYQPLISVLLPTYNTEEVWLRRCIDSVLAQSYPNWELCIADDASPLPHVRRVLEEYKQKDERIRIVLRADNGHISASTNSALALATGEYVALLDHDDELHPLALHEVVAALQTHRNWKLIYTDEDKIDPKGRRYDPYMKPDWNYDLLLGHNCVSHLGIYQRELMLQIGGFRKGYEGSQDWDLALRFCERLSPDEIGHVSRVLYHWRAIPGSTSVGVGEKNYARDAGLKAIENHLARIGTRASVQEVGGQPGHFRIHYQLDDQPKVSIIIPTRDGLSLLRRCVDSILEKTTYPNYEIVIVDNQSTDPATLEYFISVVQDSRVRVLEYDHPFNYSAVNNFAVSNTGGELIALVNNDIEVITPGWLEELAGHAIRSDIGCVGAMLYYPNDTIQHAGVVLGVHGVAAHIYCGKPKGWPGQMGRAGLTQSLSAVTAACLMVRREVYEQVGGLDEKLRVAFNDVDFCLRVREAGYRNVWSPFAELYHHESASRGQEDSPEKKARFAGEVEFMQERWGQQLMNDPAYNPNLSISDTPFKLAFPPRRVG